MRDRYKTLMLRSFKDAKDVVHDYNAWLDEEFDAGVPVPPQAVPQVATLLYRSRMLGGVGDTDGFDLPDFDDKMYE